jgi:hypothetical protein
VLHLDNQSPWQAALYPGWSARRRRQTTLVIKTAYWFDSGGRVSTMDPVPAIEEAERHHDAPETSSLAAASESVPFKQGGELLCHGTAQPPIEGATVMEVKLGLRRDDNAFWHKTLRVTGPRSWRRGLLSAGPGEPGPLQPLPLRFESAYGGSDPRDPEQRYAANPVGLGYSRTSRHHPALQVPQIEQAPDYLNSLTQRPTPAGFGPLAQGWTPRSTLTPAIDEAALSQGLCPFAEDLAPDLYNAAPEDQRFDTPFEGDETLFLQGLVANANPRGILIELPGEQPRAWLARSESDQNPLTLSCDTLIVDADEQALYLLWRCAIETTAAPAGWVVVKGGTEEEERDDDPSHGDRAA